MADKENIGNMSLEELKSKMADIGEPKYRAQQIFEWMYDKHVPHFDKMTNLSKSLREKLSDKFTVTALFPEVKLESTDGSRKFRYRLHDGLSIESVVMPTPGPNSTSRLTLCVSSQAGCPLGCKFCMTGVNGFQRNLETAEILGQVISAARLTDPDQRISNIVFMGMGEPFLNYDNVVKALEILTSEDGFGYSPGRITVSTSGITDRIDEFGELGLADLAVSINSADEYTRSTIMPVNRKYSLTKLMQALRYYPASAQKRITFEYVLLDGLNDSTDHAENFVSLVSGIHCKVNLIPFNECDELEFRKPSLEKIKEFKKRLENALIPVFIRESRGRDISAACGQLAGMK